MNCKILDVLKAKCETSLDYIESPGEFERMVDIAEVIVKTLRENKLNFAESKIIINLVLQILEYCSVGEISDFEN